MPADVRVYNRRPLQVEAAQLTADADWEAIAQWCGGVVTQRPADYRDVGGPGPNRFIAFRTNNPLMPSSYEAHAGDWIVKGPEGFYQLDGETDGFLEIFQPQLTHFAPGERQGWFARQCDPEVDDCQPPFVWQPAIQLDSRQDSLDTWFKTKEECLGYIRKQIIGHGELPPFDGRS